MKRHNSTTHHAPDLESLAEDARALLAATTDVAEEKVVQARERLAEALDRGKATWVRVQDRAVEGAKATDQAIRTHPYQSLGIAFGLGAVIGLLLARRN